MKIIVGLGNPGKKYANTRHNVGFMALDDYLGGFISGDNIPSTYTLKPENKFDSWVIQLPYKNKTILLVKPQTFMNKSGRAVKQICNFYKTDISKDLLIIHDDADLPLGTTRTTDSASSAGHNGVQDIIEKLDTQSFCRIRIGIDARTSRLEIGTEDYVLQNFTSDELKKLREAVLPKIKLEVENFLKTEK